MFLIQSTMERLPNLKVSRGNGEICIRGRDGPDHLLREGESDMVDLMGDALPNDFSHESFSL